MANNNNRVSSGTSGESRWESIALITEDSLTNLRSTSWARTQERQRVSGRSSTRDCIYFSAASKPCLNFFCGLILLRCLLAETICRRLRLPHRLLLGWRRQGLSLGLCFSSWPFAFWFAVRLVHSKAGLRRFRRIAVAGTGVVVGATLLSQVGLFLGSFHLFLKWSWTH